MVKKSMWIWKIWVRFKLCGGKSSQSCHPLLSDYLSLRGHSRRIAATVKAKTRLEATSFNFLEYEIVTS